jgi:putative transposase
MDDTPRTHWPHAPMHRLGAACAYIVTAGTYLKAHRFRDPRRLSVLQDQLLTLAIQYGWQLQAWAVFSNHYHFVAVSPENPGTLRTFIRHLHAETAREVNRLDRTEGQRVWFQYWDTQLTFERSYLARLNYVQQNPVRHGVVSVASAYPWCSAGWFEQTAPPAFFKTVSTFKIDRVEVPDEFEVDFAG